jgi:hypothetical protein
LVVVLFQVMELETFALTRTLELIDILLKYWNFQKFSNLVNFYNWKNFQKFPNLFGQKWQNFQNFPNFLVKSGNICQYF